MFFYLICYPLHQSKTSKIIREVSFWFDALRIKSEYQKIDISKIFTEFFPMEEFNKHCSIEGQSMHNLSVF